MDEDWTVIPLTEGPDPGLRQEIKEKFGGPEREAPPWQSQSAAADRMAASFVDSIDALRKMVDDLPHRKREDARRVVDQMNDATLRYLLVRG